jgi:hypothetical protein
MSALALIRTRHANFSLNQEDTVNEVGSSAVRKAYPSVWKLAGRLAFRIRSKYYPAQYRRSGYPISGSHFTA